MLADVRPARQFDLYRYQLLPLSQQVQLDMLRHIDSLESLKRRKNEFFAEILTQLPTLHHRKIEIIHKLDMHAGDWFVFHIAARKTLARFKPDFNVERLEDWPHVVVIISNAPDIQAIAISRNSKAFSSSSVVARMLLDNLQLLLRKYQLHLEIEALFEKRTFWFLVEQHQGQISSLTFELVSPNMANISKTLEIDLAQINRDTNSHRTDLTLNSGTGSVLEVQRNNAILNSLVDYASAGGGDIVLRVRGLKKRIRTSRSVRDVSVDEIVLSNPSPEALQFITKLFK